MDGQAGPEYDALQLADFTFFLEGEDFHWAYVVEAVEEDGKDVSFAVVDGLEGQRYDRVLSGTLRFADSKTVAFTAQKGRSFYRVTHALPSSPED